MQEPTAPPDGVEPGLDPARRWLIDRRERANEQMSVDEPHAGDQAWSTGNHARPLILGAT